MKQTELFKISHHDTFSPVLSFLWPFSAPSPILNIILNCILYPTIIFTSARYRDTITSLCLLIAVLFIKPRIYVISFLLQHHTENSSALLAPHNSEILFKITSMLYIWPSLFIPKCMTLHFPMFRWFWFCFFQINKEWRVASIHAVVWRTGTEVRERSSNRKIGKNFIFTWTACLKGNKCFLSLRFVFSKQAKVSKFLLWWHCSTGTNWIFSAVNQAAFTTGAYFEDATNLIWIPFVEIG